MSVESDFSTSGENFQADGTQISWDIIWPGVFDSHRFVGVSFLPESSSSQLVRASESFTQDVSGLLHVFELIQAQGDSSWQFSVVVTPNH